MRSPTTHWIVFKDGKLLFANEPDAKKRSLARLSTTEVRPLLGTEPFFAQGQNDGDAAESGLPVLEAARLRGPRVVFLGLHEPESGATQALPSTDFSAKADAAAVASKIEGTPYFSLDVSDLEGNAVDAVLQSTEAAKSGKSMTFVDARQAMSSMDYFEGGIVAEARAMVDWNARNKVCLTALYSIAGVCDVSFVNPPSSVRHAAPQSIHCGLDGNSRARRCFLGLRTKDGSHAPLRRSPLVLILSHGLSIDLGSACTIKRTHGLMP